jgi:hypothetical protein
MDLKKLTDRKIGRIKEFQEKKRGALIHVAEVKTFKAGPSRPLSSWNFPRDLYNYLDTVMENSDLHWAQREGLDDDLLPSVYPWFGIAEHSAIVAGDIHFAEATSYQVPYITEWEKLDSIVLSEDNKWFKMLMDGFRYLRERSEGRFLVRLRGADGPMDMANALRGNALFTDFYDCPGEVHRLLSLCEGAMRWSFEHQKKYAHQIEGGWITGYSVWLPGNSAGHISEDASVMCSPDMYRQFGRPYTEKFCAAHDQVLVHLHGLGRHAFPGIAGIPQFGCVEISNDPNAPRGMELFKRYEKILENKTVMLHLNREELEENREFLGSKKIIINCTADSLEEARGVITLVRALHQGG